MAHVVAALDLPSTYKDSQSEVRLGIEWCSDSSLIGRRSADCCLVPRRCMSATLVSTLLRHKYTNVGAGGGEADGSVLDMCSTRRRGRYQAVRGLPFVTDASVIMGLDRHQK